MIRPNDGFWVQLINYEVKLHGSNTVKLVDSPLGKIADVYFEQVKDMVPLWARKFYHLNVVNIAVWRSEVAYNLTLVLSILMLVCSINRQLICFHWQIIDKYRVYSNW